MLLDVRPDHLKMVQNILQRFVPDREVWAFGSRAKWLAKEYSDLDLCVLGETPLSFSTLGLLEEAFDESDLPYKVDVVDWATTSSSFQQIIQRDKVVVQGVGRVSPSDQATEISRCDNLTYGTDWQVYKLGDLIYVKHGFAFKSEYFSEVPTEYQLVTPGNFAIGGGFQLGKGKYYSGTVPSNYVLKKGDVVVTMTDLSRAADTLGYSALIPETVGTTWLHNQRVGLVEVKPEAPIRLGYLHYLLRSKEYRHCVVSSATGSTVKHTAPSRICDFQFSLPSVAEQEEIGKVLGTLDDRIALLRETNATLEGIAQALFKSWFVDFDPVHAKQQGIAPAGMDETTAALFPDGFETSELGLVPRGWKVETIYNVASVIYGAPFASKKFTSEKVGKPLVRIRDLKDEMPGIYTDEIHPKGYLIQPGDIVVGMDGEFRAYLWGGEPAWLNQRVCVFAPKQGVPAIFVHRSVIPLLAQVEATETATTVIHLGKNDIDRFKVVAPHKPVLEVFDAITSPLYARVVENKQQAQTLSTLRDTLLPRLISGQLRLSAAMLDEVKA